MIAFFIVMPIICVLLGYTTCALLTIAKQSDRQAEPNPPKEKTKLLTVGASVKWNGDVYEIEKFEVDEHNQTVAYIGDERFTFWVPIEELEAVEE